MLHVQAVAATASNPSAQANTNNWAVLVCTSRYWFNYRHMANTLGMYRTVKRLGIPDSQIILMLADDVACNPRNTFPGKVYANSRRTLDLYGSHIEVDYRNYEVNVENFIRLLTGRQDPALTPVGKRLDTDENSNVFVYMTGHGGDEFLKFQDQEEISAWDVAGAVHQMWTQRRYKELFFMIDTCQANTMYSRFHSPNILATGSSSKGENSYSHHADNDIGVAVIDRFTHTVLNYLEGINKTSTATMQDLFDTYDFVEFKSNAGIRTDLFGRTQDMREVRLTEFFGGVSEVELEDGGDASQQYTTPVSAEAEPAKSGISRSSKRRRKVISSDEEAIVGPRLENASVWLKSIAVVAVGHVLLVGIAMYHK